MKITPAKTAKTAKPEMTFQIINRESPTIFSTTKKVKKVKKDNIFKECQEYNIPLLPEIRYTPFTRK